MCIRDRCTALRRSKQKARPRNLRSKDGQKCSRYHLVSLFPHGKSLSRCARDVYKRQTFFKGVYKLPAAHYFVYENGKMDVRRFWDCEFDPQPQSFEACADKLDEVVHESVAAHRIADVKVGSFPVSYTHLMAHATRMSTEVAPMGPA